MSSAGSPFNTPLEAGIRLVILLTEAYPRALSLDHLVMLDHVLVHTGDFGGPPSIHPASPYRIAEPYVRRDLVQRSLVLFRSRELVNELPTNHGFVWEAGDPAAEGLVFAANSAMSAAAPRPKGASLYGPSVIPLFGNLETEPASALHW